MPVFHLTQPHPPWSPFLAEVQQGEKRKREPEEDPYEDEDEDSDD